MSWIRRVRRGKQYYLYEVTSKLENGKVKQKLIRYLGVEGDEPKVPKPKTKRIRPDKIFPERSFRAGDVSLLWQLADSLDLIGTIDRITTGSSHENGPSPGKYLVIWAINRILDPESATQLESWVKTTTIPMLAKMEPSDFTKDAFLRSLDAICAYSTETQHMNTHIPQIEEILYQKWRIMYPLPIQTSEIVAFDLTPIPTFGKACPLAENGHKTKETHQLQINLSVVTSKFNSYPIAHFVHPGSFHSISTVPNLLVRLKELNIPNGTIIWDRGYTSKEEINRVENEGWKIICGVPKRANEVKNLLSMTNPPLEPDYFVPSKCMNIYAIKADSELFGKKGSVVVYLNVDRQLQELKQRNANLAEIQNELLSLQSKCNTMTIEDVHSTIRSIIGENKKFFTVSSNQENNGIHLTWEANKQSRQALEKLDGKYLLYATDSNLLAKDITKAYFEKDFVEKVFRDLKTFEEIAPIRHRLEPRVLAIMFVCTLALRIKVALRSQLECLNDQKDQKKWSIEILLKKLQRVERIELNVGDESQVWFINLQKKTKNILDEMGYSDLFTGQVKLV